MQYIIAIDGPSGVGKSTVTEEISKKLELININSGYAYRAVAFQILKNNICINDLKKIKELLNEIDLKFQTKVGKSIICLNGENVTEKLMEKNVTDIVSTISSIKEVRFKLNEIFTKCANEKSIIMEGRDIGSNVFPNADVKIYLDASKEERIKRRYNQNIKKQISITYEEVLSNIEKRDKSDLEREMGALTLCEDAIYIDSTKMSMDEVVNKIIYEIKTKLYI